MKLLIPPPIVVLITGGLIWLGGRMFPTLQFDLPYRELIAAVICGFGMTIDIFSVGKFFREKTTVSPVSPQDSTSLVTSGTFAWSRNPMYLGMVLLITGFGIWMGNFIFVPCVILFIWYITQFQIKPEEEVLFAKFGSEYDDYCKRVRRWI